LIKPSTPRALVEEYWNILKITLTFHILYQKQVGVFSEVWYGSTTLQSKNSSFFNKIPDMIAVPDFAAGAMENWGLIIYRETAMLFKEGQSSESNRERIVLVIAHELAHMV
jgi:aminopeptidase N